MSLARRPGILGLSQQDVAGVGGAARVAFAGLNAIYQTFGARAAATAGAQILSVQAQNAINRVSAYLAAHAATPTGQAVIGGVAGTAVQAAVKAAFGNDGTKVPSQSEVIKIEEVIDAVERLGEGRVLGGNVDEPLMRENADGGEGPSEFGGGGGFGGGRGGDRGGFFGETLQRTQQFPETDVELFFKQFRRKMPFNPVSIKSRELRKARVLAFRQMENSIRTKNKKNILRVRERMAAANASAKADELFEQPLRPEADRFANYF